MSFKRINLGLATIILITSCATKTANTDSYQFGINFNKTRDSLGIPKIEADWVTHESSPTYWYWAKQDDRVRTTDPFHLKKESELADNKLISEEDHYHYELSDTLGYRLVYHYSLDSLIWRCSLVKYHRGKYPPADRIKLRLDQADSVLNNWGLRR